MNTLLEYILSNTLITNYFGHSSPKSALNELLEQEAFQKEVSFLNPLLKDFDKFQISNDKKLITNENHINKLYYNTNARRNKLFLEFWGSIELKSVIRTYDEDIRYEFDELSSIVTIKNKEFFVFKVQEATLLFLDNTVLIDLGIGFGGNANLKNIIKSIPEIFKHILAIQHYLNPQIITKEILEVTEDSRYINNSIKKEIELQQIKNHLGNFGKRNYDILIKESMNRMDSLDSRISELSLQMLRTETALENERLNKEQLQTNIAEYFNALNNDVDENTIAEDIANIIQKQIAGHFICDKDSIVIETTQSKVYVHFRTNPFKYYKFNQSPIPYLTKRYATGNWDVSSAVLDAVTEAYDALTDDIIENPWEMWNHPITIRFAIALEPRNHSGIVIKDVNTSYIDDDFTNPHFLASCYGTYASHVRKALEEGEINRFLTIQAEYMSSVTIGDGAGNGFYRHMTLTRKGERIRWTKNITAIVQKDAENQERLRKEAQM